MPYNPMQASSSASRPKNPERVANRRSRRMDSSIMVLNPWKLTPIAGLIPARTRLTAATVSVCGRLDRIKNCPPSPCRGVRAVQEHPGESFVHYGHIRRASGVALIEFAPSEEPRAQRLEVIRTYPTAAGTPPLLRVR